MSGHPRIAHFLLRAGLAFSFVYPPISALGDPTSWAAYFPRFVHALPVSTTALLHGFGVVEVVVAVWLLTGWRVRVSAALAAFILLAIVFFNLQNFEVLFRDLSIAAMALALVFWPSPSPDSHGTEAHA